jgi:hypothetical protein
MKITIITVCKTDIRFTIDNAWKSELFNFIPTSIGGSEKSEFTK